MLESETSRNMTDAKRDDALLDQEPFGLDRVFADDPDEIYAIDEQTGHFIYANSAALDNLGYTLPELATKTPLDLQVHTTVADLAERIAALRDSTRASIAFEVDYQRKDGSVYRVHHDVRLLRAYDPPAFLVRAREITSESHPIGVDVTDPFRHLVEDADDGIWVIDAANRTTYANDAIARMLGCKREEMIGRTPFDFMDDEWRALAAKNLERRKAGERQHLEFKYIRSDGSTLWSIIATHPIFDTGGLYAGSYAIVTDITERKRREETLLEGLHLESGELATPAGGPLVVSMPAVSGLRSMLVAKRFALLADARRLELIELLASREERSVSALARALAMSQSNVSKHLRQLAEAGLLVRRQAGTSTFYALADSTVPILCRVVCQWLGAQAQAEYEALAS
jgi:PAS domain S-box-containing protein